MKNRDVLNDYNEQIEDEYASRERRRRRRIKEQVMAYVVLVIVAAAVITGGTIGVKTLISSVQAYNEDLEQAIADAVEEQSQAIESEELAKSEALEQAMEEASKEAEIETKTEPEIDPLDELVASLMQDMSLADKVAAMFVVTPESITGVGKAVRAGDSTKQAITENPVGGIVYAKKNYQSDSQFLTMLANTREYSKYPLFMAADWQLAEEQKASFGIDLDFEVLRALNTEGIALNEYQVEIDGLNISGYMNEKVVTDYYSSADAAVAAIQVGVDMIVAPADYKSAYQGVLDAISNGLLAEERIHESVRKIYRVKYKDALEDGVSE